MKKPQITNRNCSAPWTFGHRIRQWEVVYKDERLVSGEDELYVLRVLVENKDVFVIIEGEGSDPQTLSFSDLTKAKSARQIVLAQRRFRWRWGWRVRVLLVIGDAHIEVSHLV